MPPPLRPLWDHYVALDRARRSGKYHGSVLAAIAWREALLLRAHGEDLLATEGYPDSADREFVYGSDNVAFHRSQPGGVVSLNVDTGVTEPAPPVAGGLKFITNQEIARVRKNTDFPTLRFHYRRTAADIAWLAGSLLPANHPDLARLYNTAGKWYAARDPQGADRFYQAMVRRCAETDAGCQADARRWFLPDLEPLGEMSGVPARLLPALPKMP